MAMAENECCQGRLEAVDSPSQISRLTWSHADGQAETRDASLL